MFFDGIHKNSTEKENTIGRNYLEITAEKIFYNENFLRQNPVAVK